MPIESASRGPHRATTCVGQQSSQPTGIEVALLQFRPRDFASDAGAASFCVFDGAEAEEAADISTVFVETPSRPTMVNPLNDVMTGTTFCVDAAATPSV
jgi:hypothetical protein